MDILQVLYTGKNQRVFYLLYLGTRDGKLIGLEISKINPKEKQSILNHLFELSSYTLDKRIAWLKTNCASAYKSGYKQILPNNFKILETNPIKT